MAHGKHVLITAENLFTFTIVQRILKSILVILEF